MSHTQASSDPGEPAWVTEVLNFWFQELGEAHWFANSNEIDAQIRDRFLSLHQRLSRCCSNLQPANQAVRSVAP